MIQKEQRLAQKARVFLSYSSEDGWYARTLLERLARHPDVDVVFATQTLSAAGDWRRRLKEELEGCTVFLVVLSMRSLRSPYVLHELGAAWALGKPIVAVVTDPEARAGIPLGAGQARLVEVAALEEPEALSSLFFDHGDEEETDANGGAG